MYYVQMKDVSYEDAIKVINNSIDLQGISQKDLVKIIGYQFEAKGAKEIELFLSGKHPREKPVRIKIGKALEISDELLLGLRGFECREDAIRFSFCPYLVSIPENTRPSQISVFGFLGFEQIFIAGRYRNLLNKPLPEQLEYIENEVQNGISDKNVVALFGKKLGYAFHWDFDQPAVALSVDGKLNEDMTVTYQTFYSCSVTVKTKTLLETEGFHIPRLTPKDQIINRVEP